MALSLTTAPTVEPLTTAEVKAELRIDHSNDNDRIDNFILPTARQLAETICHRAFLNQTYTLRLTGFGTGPILLPRPPVSSVTSVAYIDSAGDSQTWASSKYTVETPSGHRAMVASIQPTYTEVYPSTQGVVDAVTIVYVAGYGAAASSLPAGIKQGVALLCQYVYGGFEDETIYQAASMVLAPYWAWRADLRFD
jgi:uncharacterized phiE125 gp8 family phage protein